MKVILVCLGLLLAVPCKLATRPVEPTTDSHAYNYLTNTIFCKTDCAWDMARTAVKNVCSELFPLRWPIDGA